MSKAQQLQELIIKFNIRVEVKPHFSEELREIELHIGTKF
ncbi:MAG: hypothetical protein ACJAUD_002198 [Crocinitomicaceae bacterium]